MARNRQKPRPFVRTPPEVVRLICHWTQIIYEADLRRIEEEERLARQNELDPLLNPLLDPHAGPNEEPDHDSDEWSTDEEMPALEAIDGSGPQAEGEDEDAMPGLEPMQASSLQPDTIEAFKAGLAAALAKDGFVKKAQDTDEDEDSEDEDEEEDRGPTFELGLPKNAFVILALVSRPFLHAARSLLYSAPINLKQKYQAYLFARTVLQPSSALVDGSPKSLAELVQHINFGTIRDSMPVRTRAVPSPGSLGRGGHSINFDLLNALPNLRIVGSSTDFLKDAERPLDRLMRDGKLRQVTNFAMAAGTDLKIPFKLTIRRVETMAAGMTSLKELTMMTLDSGDNVPTVPIQWQLTRLTLNCPDVNDHDLDILTGGLTASLSEFALIHPTENLSRGALEKLAIRFGPTLRKLDLHLGPHWHPRVHSPTTTVDDQGVSHPASVHDHPFPLDILIRRFQRLHSLAFVGPIASLDLFRHASPSLEHIKWQGCPAIKPKALAKLLRTSTVLPGLKTLDAGGDAAFWPPEDRKILLNRLELRGCKFIDHCRHNHPILDDMHGTIQLGPFPLNLNLGELQFQPIIGGLAGPFGAAPPMPNAPPQGQPAPPQQQPQAAPPQPQAQGGPPAPAAVNPFASILSGLLLGGPHFG